MRKTLQFIVFLKNFSLGVMVPVLSLVLLTHGATIATISLAIGAYSVTVILMEFPSGVFADLCGRKNAFLLSAALSLFSYCLLLISRSAAMLFPAMVLNGLGRAFSSGSIDALMIDQANERGVALERVTTRLAILESAGLAAGALAGGALSGIGVQYFGNLGVNAVIYLSLLFLTLIFVRESPRPTRPSGTISSSRLFAAQMKESLAFMRTRGTVRVLFVLCLATGFSLISIETYWQPALSALQAPYWLFGAVSFGGFAFVMLGNWLAQSLLRRHSAYGVWLLLGVKALLGVSLALLLFQNDQIPFIALYLIAYLFIGGGSVVENTLLNRLASPSHRASILSLFSFVLQLGALVAALCGYFVSAYGRFQNMWLISGALLLLLSAIFGLFRRKAAIPEATDSEPAAVEK